MASRPRSLTITITTTTNLYISSSRTVTKIGVEFLRFLFIRGGILPQNHRRFPIEEIVVDFDKIPKIRAVLP